MSYAVEFTAKAATETRGLPAEAFIALVAVLGGVARDPLGATQPDDPGDPAWRCAFFAELGIVSIYVDSPREVLRVHAVTWAG